MLTCEEFASPGLTVQGAEQGARAFRSGDGQSRPRKDEGVGAVGRPRRVAFKVFRMHRVEVWQDVEECL